MPDTIKLSHYPMTAAWPEVLGLKEGDSIEIHVADRRVSAIEKAPTSKQLLERLRKYRGRLADGETSMMAVDDLAVRRPLELAGVEFIDENGGGLGVRLRKLPQGRQRK